MRIMDIRENLRKYKIVFLDHAVEYTARLVLLILVGSMSYIVLLPQYNFAHLIPHDTLDDLGISYASQLWFEQNSDILLHFAGGALLVLLLSYANLFKSEHQSRQALITVVILCLAAECAQLWIGRGFDEYDLLFGISGSFMAYLGVNWLLKQS